MEGSDVVALQRFLNQDPATLLALAGPGSRGAETAYFGPATEAAVKRFQLKYGATVASGIVDAITAAQFRQLALSANILPVNASPGASATQARETESSAWSASDLLGSQNTALIQAFTPPPVSPTLKLMNVSPASGERTITLTLSGLGFPAGPVEIHTTLGTVNGVTSADRTKLFFALPPAGDVSATQFLSGLPAGELGVDNESAPVAPDNSVVTDSGFPVWIYLKDATGISNSLIFNLTD